ncbi:MAG: ABC transporter ATP-binding protein, partial [Rhodococcus sp. (in: high G+C Gram-positive bacteria)]
EVVCLLGRNGVGKSTTVMSISGLLRPTAGSIHLGDEDITGWSSHRRARGGMGLVPQGRRLFTGLSVEENLRAGVVPAGVAEHRYGWTIEETYQRFPILEQRRKVAAGLMSGGEQQMLALARALICSPRLLVLDEPSEGLAPLIVEQIVGIIAEVKAHGGTVLLVEQNLGLGLAAADRVYIMSKGQMVASGAADEISADHALMTEHLGIG